jgi:histone-lysine N-methyltransferase SETD2
VLDKFRHKLPKDELKRLGKEIALKLVKSDYKNNRVSDPTAELNEKQVNKIKKYVRDFLDRAVQKYDEHQKRRAAKEGQKGAGDRQEAEPSTGSKPDSTSQVPVGSPLGNGDVTMADEGDDMSLSEAGQDGSPSGSDLKRKRDGEPTAPEAVTPSDGPDAKRLKEDTEEATPPPPPPPPPMDSPLDDAIIAEQQALREQEEALERENEEAQRLEDEANKTKQLENAAKDMERDIAAGKLQASKGKEAETETSNVPHSNGQASPLPGDETKGAAAIDEQNRARKREVLGH